MSSLELHLKFLKFPGPISTVRGALARLSIQACSPLKGFPLIVSSATKQLFSVVPPSLQLVLNLTTVALESITACAACDTIAALKSIAKTKKRDGFISSSMDSFYSGYAR
jgi:hypothetical protein